LTLEIGLNVLKSKSLRKNLNKAISKPDSIDNEAGERLSEGRRK